MLKYKKILRKQNVRVSPARQASVILMGDLLGSFLRVYNFRCHFTYFL